MSDNKNLGSVLNTILIQESYGKKWYTSKTVWVNILATVALAVQFQTGFIIGPELQAIALSVVNLLLRKVTRTEITL